MPLFGLSIRCPRHAFQAKATLYLIPNATKSATTNNSDVDVGDGGDGAPQDSYVAVVLETLISINGTKKDPVRGVTVQGITFRDAADITMNPWGVPSGGDWGLYRGGAIFVEGAEDVTIQHNTLTRLDGNGAWKHGMRPRTFLFFPTWHVGAPAFPPTGSRCG